MGESFADAVMSQEDSQASAACQTFTGSSTVLLQDQRGFSCSTLALIFDLGGTVFSIYPPSSEDNVLGSCLIHKVAVEKNAVIV